MQQNRQIENLKATGLVNACVIIAVFACTLILGAWSEVPGQQKAPQRQPKPAPIKPIPDDVMLRIVRAEDERRWDNDLGILLFDKDARVRVRAALAAGRIGDERATASLTALLQTDMEESVRAMSAFALGETESAVAAAALSDAAQKVKETSEVRARAIEALGKIIAALPKADEARGQALGQVILKTLDDELRRSPKPNRAVVLLGLTAALRARPTGAGAIVAKFLSSGDVRVRGDAANTLARLRAKDGLEQLRLLLASDTDAVVRANAARVLGAAEDTASLDTLIARASNDTDERVRVSSIRALASLKDARAAASLSNRASTLMSAYRAAKASGSEHPRETNELLEIATSLSRLLANTSDERAIAWLRAFREMESASPEIEIAFARIAPFIYLRETPLNKLADERLRAEMMRDWRRVSALAQALSEISGISAEAAGSGIVSLQADAQIILRSWIDDSSLPAQAAPDVLRALAAFKGSDFNQVLRKQMSAKDVVVRATAAELLGELQPDEANARALAEALPASTRDELNDASLSILDSLAKQKSPAANEAIKTMLDSQDNLVRRRAATLLKANGAGDFSQRVAPISPRNTAGDYARALARLGKSVRAVVSTDKGAFTIELLPDDAPLNVDNFVQLAQSGYFNNITFHRVVPNFVVQGGDPRGDGNGGPGYQIRCEINEVTYERGAVGMALSGKDTGGSQWFVTHSPQPHLDGGYTVFGRVVAGMEVVDRVARGDRISKITVTESARDASKSSTTPPGETKKKRTGKP
ncbi:MAG: peptidylprolyl isomerase [Acidobacteria bacterium]|nr:peptidylprolyl isomerase [Acidobacteriota bacterium]